jgi:hypothetical protein
MKYGKVKAEELKNVAMLYLDEKPAVSYIFLP